MHGDGNGWVTCRYGHRHWGRFGAAGLLVTDGTRVLLQHRAAWTHEGGTWAVPGGARDSHEDPTTAALREATEETSLDPSRVRAFDVWIDDHVQWSYTTVLARPQQPDAHDERELHVEPTNPESDDVRWWRLDDVEALHLHRGFAASWPHLRALIARDCAARNAADDTADDTADGAAR